MKINFNNVRKQAFYAYHNLQYKLESGIENGKISIRVEDIQEEMDELAQLVGSIAYSFDKNNDDFKDLYEELGDVVFFNQKAE